MNSATSPNQSLVVSNTFVAHSLRELGRQLAFGVHPSSQGVLELNDYSLGVGAGSERHTAKINRVRRVLATRRPNLRQVAGLRRRLSNRITKKVVAKSEYLDVLRTYPVLQNLVVVMLGFCDDKPENVVLLAELLPKVLNAFAVHFNEENIGLEDAIALLNAYREEELQRRRGSRSATSGGAGRGAGSVVSPFGVPSSASSTAMVVYDESEDEDAEEENVAQLALAMDLD